MEKQNFDTKMYGNAPLIGAIRWDAWFPGNVFRGFVDPSLYSDYSCREPFYGWFDAAIPNHMEIMDSEIQGAASKNLDFWAFVWYPKTDGHPGIRKLTCCLDDYMCSSRHSLLKFALILQTSWVSGKNLEHWRESFVPEFVEKMLDSQYVKVEGNRPLLFWMDTADLDTEKGFGERWQEELTFFFEKVQEAGLGCPLVADMRNDHLSAARFGFDAVSDYGPASTGGLRGHQPFSVLAAHDMEKMEFPHGLKAVPGITALDDPRPRDLGEWGRHATFQYGNWFEIPTAEEWLRHVEYTWNWLRRNPDKTTQPGVMVIYAWNELDEGGPGIVPTKQEGTMFLDMIHAVKTGNMPHSIVNRINCTHPSIRFTGEWQREFPVKECCNHDLYHSSKPGDFFEFDFYGQWVTIQGEKGPGCGAVDIYLDGTLAASVDLFEAEQDFGEVYKSELLNLENHTIKVLIREKEPGPMLGNGFSLDCILWETVLKKE